MARSWRAWQDFFEYPFWLAGRFGEAPIPAFPQRGKGKNQWQRTQRLHKQLLIM